MHLKRHFTHLKMKITEIMRIRRRADAVEIIISQKVNPDEKNTMSITETYKRPDYRPHYVCIWCHQSRTLDDPLVAFHWASEFSELIHTFWWPHNNAMPPKNAICSSLFNGPGKYLEKATLRVGLI